MRLIEPEGQNEPRRTRSLPDPEERASETPAFAPRAFSGKQGRGPVGTRSRWLAWLGRGPVQAPPPRGNAPEGLAWAWAAQRDQGATRLSQRDRVPTERRSCFPVRKCDKSKTYGAFSDYQQSENALAGQNRQADAGSRGDELVHEAARTVNDGLRREGSSRTRTAAGNIRCSWPWPRSCRLRSGRAHGPPAACGRGPTSTRSGRPETSGASGAETPLAWRVLPFAHSRPASRLSKTMSLRPKMF